MQQPKPSFSETWTGRGRRTLLAAWFLLLVLACRPDSAAADEPAVRYDGETAASLAVASDSLARIPPVETVSFNAPEPPEPADFFIGYDNGFVIANQRAEASASDDFPFALRVNSWLQLRHTYFDASAHNPNLNLLSIERLRLSFGGHAYSPNLNYFFQLDGNTDQGSAASFLDYFVSYDLGREFCGWDAETLGVRAGKRKVPFSRSREESGRRLQFADRSTANLFFDLNRSIGMSVFGTWDAWPTPVRWETAIFNGFQSGGDTNIRDSGLDDNFAWSSRVQTDLYGEFGNDGETDLSWHEQPALRLGCGFAWTKVDSLGVNEFNQPRVVDSGARLASLLPLETSAFDAGLYTVDLHWKHRGRSLIFEYYWRHLADFAGGDVPSLTDHGFNLQAGHFIVPRKLELLARWARIAGDSGTLGGAAQSTDEVGLGAVWYLRGHSSKFVLDASRLNGMPLDSPRLDVPAGAAGFLMRLQMQVAF